MKTGISKAVFNRHSLYFASLGIAFMLIEVSLIQKFAVFLGHPTYSITVVLFTMLLFSGIGSFLSRRLREKIGVKGLFLLLILVVATVGTANMFVLPYFSSWSIAPRILYSFATMALAGFFMGMPFPTGLSLLNKKVSGYAPWFWGINGAASVVSSVSATAISIFYGISATFFTGLVFYFAAFATGILIEKAAEK
jgi:MFS family permease